MRKLTILICLFFLLSSPAVSQAEEPDPVLWLKATSAVNNPTLVYFYIPDLLNSNTNYQVYEGYKIVTIWALIITKEIKTY